jgi:galactokinase
MVALVEADSVEQFSRGVREAYSSSTGIAAEVYAVDAAEGAQLFEGNPLR